MAKRKAFSINPSLSRSLEETMLAAQDYTGQLLVEVIAIDRLELDPDNPRELHLEFSDVRQGIIEGDVLAEKKKTELAALESLSKSIASQGLINPITVYKHHDKYRLIAGERRTLSSILAGKTQIQCRILESKPNALNRVILQWMENNEREDLTLWERLNNLRSILKAYSDTHDKNPERVTAAELSDLTGMSLSQAAQYRLVLQASDTVWQAIKENKIANLDKAAFIVKVTLKDQDALISLCEQGASLKELKTATDKFVVQKSSQPLSSPPVFTATVKGEKAMRIILQALAQQNLVVDPKNVLDLTGKALVNHFQEVIHQLC